MQLSKLCTPAMLYLVFSAITIIYGVMQNFKPMTLVVNVLFVALWTWILNWLCSKGYSIISWVLVVLPFFLIMSTCATTMEVLQRS